MAQTCEEFDNVDGGEDEMAQGKHLRNMLRGRQRYVLIQDVGVAFGRLRKVIMLFVSSHSLYSHIFPAK